MLHLKEKWTLAIRKVVSQMEYNPSSTQGHKTGGVVAVSLNELKEKDFTGTKILLFSPSYIKGLRNSETVKMFKRSPTES